MQNALLEAEKNLASVQDRAFGNHAKYLSLEQENEHLRADLQDFEAMEAEVQRYRNMNVNPRDLETFLNNKAAIKHYLKLVPMLIE